jgi:hypothetical protein
LRAKRGNPVILSFYAKMDCHAKDKLLARNDSARNRKTYVKRIAKRVRPKKS